MSRRKFPKRVLARYSELLLRHVHQQGGRERYVAVAEIEDALGLEEQLILDLCRTRLLGEVHVANRAPAELDDIVDACSPLERAVYRDYLARPHVRIRPPAVRWTEAELLGRRRKGRDRK